VLGLVRPSSKRRIAGWVFWLPIVAFVAYCSVAGPNEFTAWVFVIVLLLAITGPFLVEAVESALERNWVATILLLLAAAAFIVIVALIQLARGGNL
jgi:hypothetical protein